MSDNSPHIMANADERNNLGFPVIPFALLWPILKIIIVPVLQQILPELLELLANKIRNGQAATFSEDELSACVDRQQSLAQARYRS